MAASSRKMSKEAARLSESGDPCLWPAVKQLYRDEDGVRNTILGHLLPYWSQYPQLLIPFLDEIVQDLDPNWAIETLLVASHFPCLTERVVCTLRTHCSSLDLDDCDVVGVLACLFGLADDPYELILCRDVAARSALAEETVDRLRRDYGDDLRIDTAYVSAPPWLSSVAKISK